MKDGSRKGMRNRLQLDSAPRQWTGFCFSCQALKFCARRKRKEGEAIPENKQDIVRGTKKMTKDNDNQSTLVKEVRGTWCGCLGLMHERREKKQILRKKAKIEYDIYAYGAVCTSMLPMIYISTWSRGATPSPIIYIYTVSFWNNTINIMEVRLLQKQPVARAVGDPISSPRSPDVLTQMTPSR